MNLEQLRSFFEKDAYAKACGITIEEAENGRAVCSFQITENHLNGRQSVQGGAIFTLADFTFAVAAHSKDQKAVSLENQISFMHAAKGTKLTATASEVTSTRKVCFYQVDVTDDLGCKVARMSVTGYIMQEK